ncbi:MAG: hypothetical protein HY835_11690, partial [Anaerolineae bacterium]|nr:hypothetical protein [Anaerolineae bacterium]
MRKLLTSGNFIRLLTGWTVVTTLFMLVMAVVFMPPNARAVIFMGAGLVLIWSLGGGFWMWHARERVRTFVLGIRWPW